MDTKPNPFPQWPRGLSRKLASSYIGVSLMMFDRMVAEGLMPQPKRFYGRTIWDRTAVDSAFDVLDVGAPRDEAGEEIWEWHSAVDASERNVSTPHIPRFLVADEKWARAVPRYKICTKEKIALRSLVERGGKAHVSMMQKGAGGVALRMLSLRHYATLIDGDPNDFRTQVYQITEAGRNAWNEMDAKTD